MLYVRPYRPNDLAALYKISVGVANDGQDASHLYQDPDVMGHIYVGPYGKLAAEYALVVEQGSEIMGFVIGVPDTASFEAQLEEEWWPDLRARYPCPQGNSQLWTPDERRHHRFHHPRRTPSEITDLYPAHFHLNLLAPLRGKGLGQTLIEKWIEAMLKNRPTGIHVGVNPGNSSGIAFWQKCGFEQQVVSKNQSRDVAWLTQKIYE